MLSRPHESMQMRQGASLGNRNLAKPWFMLVRSLTKSGPNNDGSVIFTAPKSWSSRSAHLNQDLAGAYSRIIDSRNKNIQEGFITRCVLGT
jgi:hypothetical protein